MKDITPERYRCSPAVGGCPAVFDLGDGRFAVRGKIVGGNAEALIEVDPQMIVAALKEQSWAQDDRRANPFTT